eukprot:m51a1_g13066 hypothetical protein (116) ;mRNA; r:1008-2850
MFVNPAISVNRTVASANWPAGTCAEELVRGKVPRDDVTKRLVAACTEFTNDKARVLAARPEQVARTFVGPEGVVFRILRTSARDQRSLSYVEDELVLLLSPNVTLRESPDDVYTF